MTNNTAIIFCNETGLLEQQSLLLIASIKRHIKSPNISLFSCSPRAGSQPTKETLQTLSVAGVEQISDIINTEFLDYPIANKLLAARHIELNYPQLNSMIFVDSDTVFMNDINPLLESKLPKLYLRPVDNKGPGSVGEQDPKDDFWQHIFDLFDMPVSSTYITTTVRQERIRSYFNAGFIWAHHLPGFFQQWYVDFLTIVASNLRPFGYQSRDGDDFRCLDQVALSVTASRYAEYLQVLPESYNYPLPFRPVMRNRPAHPRFNQLVHVHYHKWFQHPGFLDHVCDDEDKKSEQYKWLVQNLPLEPTIYDDFKC